MKDCSGWPHTHRDTHTIHTAPGLTSFQQLVGVDGGIDTDPGLMLIKQNDLITVKRLRQNTV